MKRLLYFFDPLCGWCYGFAPVLAAFQNKHKIPCEYITGGMITGDREGRVEASFADYILKSLPRLTDYTGAETGDEFRNKLSDRSMYFSSVTPSLAVQVAKKLLPDQVGEFSFEMQKRHFILGEDLRDRETYDQLSKQFGADADLFWSEMNREETRHNFSQDMQFSANAGITGFPALVLQTNEQYYLMARGYSPLESLEQVLQSIASEQTQT